MQLHCFWVFAAWIEKTHFSSQFFSKGSKEALSSTIYPKMRRKLFKPFVSTKIGKHHQDYLLVNPSQVLYLGTSAAKTFGCQQAISETKSFMSILTFCKANELQYL